MNCPHSVECTTHREERSEEKATNGDQQAARAAQPTAGRPLGEAPSAAHGVQPRAHSPQPAAQVPQPTATNGQRTTTRRRLALAGAAVVLIAIVIAVVLATRGGSSTSPTDARLQQAATQALRSLNAPHGRLPVTDTTLKSFQAWVYNVEPVFSRLARKPQPAGQFMQIQFDDPNTMPPQILGLNAPGHAFLNLDPTVTAQVAQSGRSQFASAQLNGQNVRIYVAAITPPGILKGSGMYGLLEVVGKS